VVYWTEKYESRDNMGKKAKIGENIRHVRKAFHETQKDLAAALHVNESTVSGWESGRNHKVFSDLL